MMTPQATSDRRKYAFFWGLLGDLEAGRPNLGPTTRVEVYRLMQYCFRDVLEQEFGAKKADEIFYRAGHLAGKQFYENVIGPIEEVNLFVKKLQEALLDMNIGILRIEEKDLANGRLVMTVAEDLDCSGLPELNFEVCTYDEGFIAAVLESFFGKPFRVKEVDCWCTNDRTCRFEATMEANPSTV